MFYVLMIAEFSLLKFIFVFPLCINAYICFYGMLSGFGMLCGHTVLEYYTEISRVFLP